MHVLLSTEMLYGYLPIYILPVCNKAAQIVSFVPTDLICSLCCIWTHLEGTRPSLSFKRPLHQPYSPFSMILTSSFTFTLSSSSSLAVCAESTVATSLSAMITCYF